MPNPLANKNSTLSGCNAIPQPVSGVTILLSKANTTPLSEPDKMLQPEVNATLQPKVNMTLQPQVNATSLPKVNATPQPHNRL
jgi:hypothetical protein